MCMNGHHNCSPMPSHYRPAPRQATPWLQSASVKPDIAGAYGCFDRGDNGWWLTSWKGVAVLYRLPV